jgi:hypothetical protein
MSSSIGADAVSATNEPKPDLKPLRILELIKNAQQKHGLRHENYQRYRFQNLSNLTKNEYKFKGVIVVDVLNESGSH